MLKVERHFIPLHTAFSISIQDVPSETALLEALQKKTARKKRDESSSQEVKFIAPDGLNVDETPKKRTRTTGQPTKKAAKVTRERQENIAKGT